MLSLGSLALLVWSLVFFSGVKPCWAGSGVWWASVSICLLVYIGFAKLLFSLFLFVSVLTGC